METTARSIVKAISYRILGSLCTAGIVAVLTGNLKLSAGAGALDVVVKLAAYFAHERIWNSIPFGRQRSSWENRPA